ncbi:MAG: ATP-grasp domain-containing protein [Gemmatimonadaceae bacterium]|nr:ATP-grasp domain-containing protein [Gemmatimonadaceae bacterium]
MIPVIFAAPRLSENASRMVEAIASLPEVRLGVISTDWPEHAPPATRAAIAQHWRVDDVLDRAQLARAVKEVARRIGGCERLFGAYEQLQVPLAEVREALGIDGLSSHAARNFRDKARMKDVLRAAGLPCARHAECTSWAQAVQFAERTGFPLVLKPVAGAGAQATYRVDDGDALTRALELLAPSPSAPVQVEEFITGDEHSLETVSIGGVPVWHSLTHYHPTPLEVLRNPWIQWVVVLPREVDDHRYDDIKRTGDDALAALGMGTGVSHMEWFRRRDGSLAIGEVGARPPGAQITTLVSRSTDTDFVRSWADVMVNGSFIVPERRYAVAAAYLRGQGSGVVRHIHGIEQVHQEFGHMICDARLPHLGQGPTGSYEGDGFIILRHPETAVVEHAVRRVVELVKVELG